MAKKGEKGHYARERDAKAAALKQGLKQDDYEIVSGPKGYSIRMKRKHVPVPNAKLHVGKEPEAEAKVVITKAIEGHPHIFKDPEGRYRYSDESEGLSNESFETIEAAEEALHQYAKSLQPPTKTIGTTTGRFSVSAPPSPVEPPVAPPPPVEATPAPVAEVKEDLSTKVEYDVQLEAEINQADVIGTAKCPQCQSVVPIAQLKNGEQRVTPHGNPSTDEDCAWSLAKFEGEVAPVAPPKAPWEQNGLPQDQFKPHELAKIQGTQLHEEVHSRPGSIPRVKKSTTESPTKKVWAIADDMITANPKITRKEVIQECIRQGIATFTARTQYQQWSVARRESLQHAEEANNKLKK